MTSQYIREDVEAGEVVAIEILSLPQSGVWTIARVVAPTEPEVDSYRAYPDQFYSNKIGLICATAKTVEQVKQQARAWH